MNAKLRISVVIILLVILGLSGLGSGLISAGATPLSQRVDSNPPDRVVKLVFIHHSTGENWLTDGYGDLGRSLGENNYFVSDTNYGWGPQGIGDRTDIPDWLEWFAGNNTELYMEALFNENGQNSSYTRTLPDPGGENQIILFKSCFPNSDLEGSPDDPPSADGWLSVGHAKYVYNGILKYFGQHPEKLFIVITAPPLSDSGNAANARAFNLWLVNDWLQENEYPYQNVGVFDFYNVLTGRDGHHTFENGQELHQIAGKDTLYYPSGDDHPSKNGSQKATDEFIPLLNYFYNRWQADSPTPLPPEEMESGEDSDINMENETERAAPAAISGLLDDFEGAPPVGSGGWEAYWDEGTPTTMACGVEADAGSSGSGLRLEYHITPYSWGTCDLSFDATQDWSGASGLAFSVHASQSGGVLHVDLYAEDSGGRQSYLYELSLDSETEAGWIEVAIPWEGFHRVEWEEDAGAPFAGQDQISGLAFGFGTEDNEVQGVLWIDDLGWIEGESSPDQESPEMGETGEQELELDESEGVGWYWIGGMAALILLGAVVFYLIWRARNAT